MSLTVNSEHFLLVTPNPLTENTLYVHFNYVTLAKKNKKQKTKTKKPNKKNPTNPNTHARTRTHTKIKTANHHITDSNVIS